MKFLWAMLFTTFCVVAALVYTKLKKARRRSKDARSNGLYIISNPENAKFVIVAVHGLGTHPERTWEALPPRSRDSTEKTQPVHLLRHILKEDFPEARILMHAHNSDWMINAPVKTARQIGEQLIAELTEHLSKHSCLPIVFIGHSFGGIIIKEVIRHNRQHPCRHIPRNSPSGSPLSAIGATVTAVTSILGSSNTLLLMLRYRNDQLLDLERRFNILIKLKDARRGKTELLAFCEAKPLTLGWLSLGLVVDRISARGIHDAREYLIDTDHSGLNKCRNKSDPLYVELQRQVKRLIPNTTPKLNDSQLFVKAQLSCVPGAVFDDVENGAEACLDRTRVELLGDIREWMCDPNREPLCWLHGKAGTGKSTIAQSVARELAAKGLLAASFFFKRGEGDRGRSRLFYPTIAAQLASSFPAAAAQMRHTIEGNPDIASKSLGEQFRMLVLKPLENVSVASSMTVVIDALDECDGENDIKAIITQLSQIKKITSIPLNFFITSRNEPPIREGFKSIQSTVGELKLEEVSDPSVEQDIERFLRFRLEGIRSRAILPPNWPTVTEFNRLLKTSVPLFIYAATACRFIENNRIPGGPESRLRRWTEHQEGYRLHPTYRPILKQLIDGLDVQDRKDIIKQFREVVGTIIVLAEPLDATSLECLLSKPPHDFDGLLEYLHSVLDIPSSRVQRIKLFHLSFRDYLVDPDGGALEFHVDEKEAQRRVARDCLRLLSNGQSLRQDICSLSHPGTKRRNVPQTKIDECLPPEVQYACLHWADHFLYGEELINDQDAVYSFLCNHLLHWFEALSLLNRLDNGVSQVLKLQERTTGLQAKAFMRDARQFIAYFSFAIEDTPLQLYASGLTFAPLSSIVRNTFQARRPKWINELRPIETSWSRQFQIFDESGTACSAAFTADNHLAIGALDGTITVRDPATRQTLQVSEGHRGKITQCSLAPNGTFIASSDHSTSVDGTIKFWDLTSGTCLKTTHIRLNAAGSFAIAANGLLASNSGCGTVKLWDTKTGECLWTCPVIARYGSGIALASDNGKIRLAVADTKRHIRVFDTATQSCLQTLNDVPRPKTETMAFVLTSRHELLVVSYQSALRVYDLDTGACMNEKNPWRIAIRPTTLPDGNPCQQVVLVPLRRRHATLEFLTDSGRVDYVISIDDLANSTNGAMKVLDVLPSVDVLSESQYVLSNDEKWLLKLERTRSHSSSVLLCDMQIDQEVRETQKAAAPELGYKANNDGHGGTIHLCLSIDATLVAAMSSDHGIRIWDHDTGIIQQILYYHSDRGVILQKMALSPNKRLLATVTNQSNLRVWDLRTGTYIANLGFSKAYSQPAISGLSFSNDNEIIAYGILPFEFQLRDNKILRHGDGKLAFAKDNNLLITADTQGDIAIWDISKRNFLLPGPFLLLRTIRRNDKILRAVELSSQEEFIDLTTKKGMIKIDLVSLRSIMGHGSLQYADGWILKDDDAILWIPSEYRPPYSNKVVAIDSLKGLVCIGAESGRVWSLRLSFPELDQLVLKYPDTSDRSDDSASVISAESDASGDR
ncbi:hypothetical protein BN1708_005493 [Verticillium longisporum]|uniref:Nephrocystin 3-like N-terminal domain-containing protein n=1 Tax=Verticillium longisporum TaxID=100787 RepID=A0A0G4MB23_VERLO|nr:hypothetical protein BN1708_005493 [Verticillium longisporum]